MEPTDLEHFYEAALTAGAILSGFIGIFLNFRIQREANYYRQPVTKFCETAEQGRGQDVLIDLSRFPVSLALIFLSGACSTIFGVFLPLSGLAHWGRFSVSAATVLSGLVASIALGAAYFLAELCHYRMLRLDRDEWKREVCILLCGALFAAFIAAITYSGAHVAELERSSPH